MHVEGPGLWPGAACGAGGGLAAQLLQCVPVAGRAAHRCVQAEPVDDGTQRLLAVHMPGHCTLQRQHLLASARAEGDAVSTGRSLQRSEYAGLVRIAVVVGHVGRARGIAAILLSIDLFESTHPMNASESKSAPARQKAPLRTLADLDASATKDVSASMNGVLADMFAMYVRTKNFYLHMSSPHFRKYHVVIDEQANQLHAMTDPTAERVRKFGGTKLRLIGHITHTQRVLDNVAHHVEPLDIPAELCDDKKTLAARRREFLIVCDEHNGIGIANFIQVWTNETERRTWVLFEAGRPLDTMGR